MKLHFHQGRYYFYCPACKHGHPFDVPRWDFNGNVEKPTFLPSLRCFYCDPDTKAEITTCHLFVKDGRIQYCDDCPHNYAGKTVDMVDFPEGYGLPGVH